MGEILPLPWTFQQSLAFFGPRIFFALLCGGIVGIERQLKNKAAGIKTNMLICFGAMLYSGTAYLLWAGFHTVGITGDPTRVAAQIVSGIGFLGGGAIIQSRGNVVGLTTAATIWAVAALGFLVGIGEGPLATIIAVLIVLVLLAVSYFESRVLGHTRLYSCTIQVEAGATNPRHMLGELLESNNLELEELDLETEGGRTFVSLTFRGTRTDQKQFMLDLWAVQGVVDIDQN